jgi:hypothetical protein
MAGFLLEGLLVDLDVFRAFALQSRVGAVTTMTSASP